MQVFDRNLPRRKLFDRKDVTSNLVSFEALEPRLLLSAATDLTTAFVEDLTTPAVVERTAETEYLFDATDTESDGVLVLTAGDAPVGEDGVWWDWSGSIAIPDGPDGAWVGINCLEPAGLPSGNAVTRVVLHHEITHTYIGDLEVLVYNGSHTWIVRDNEGGSADDVNETVETLTLFDGDDPVQNWYYRVHDAYAEDTGTLTVMQLYVYYEERENSAPDISGIPNVTIEEDGTFPEAGDIIGFDGDTSAYLPAGEDDGPTGDATPTGTSYMLTANWGGTWWDAEKTVSNTEDDLMCWAATASNVLQWTGWGDVGGLATSDAIFSYFQDHWTDLGGLMEFGWDWWFDGTNNSQGWSGWSQIDVAGGGFYPTELFSSYYDEQSNDSLALTAIDEYLRAGSGVGIGIYGPGGHAITCWGFNYNPADPDDYYGIWVTDSDDSKSSDTPPDLLRYYEVTYSGGKWYLQDFYGSDAWYIGAVQALAQKPGTPTPPEPDPDAIDLWDYASDAETADDALVFTLVGVSNANAGVTLVDGRYIHVNPVANWTGWADVTVRVSDGELTDTDTFRVTVTPVNDAPVIAGVPDRSLRQDTALYYTIDLWAHTADLESWDWSLAYSITGNTNPNCGAWIVANRYIHITPTAGWNGTSDVTVQASDGALTDTDTFTVTVQAPFVDLTGTFSYFSLPASTMPGTWGYGIVGVHNAGNTATWGWIDLDMWVSDDGDITNGGDTSMGTSRRWVYVPAGGTSWQVVYYTVPAGLAEGDYVLCLDVDAGDEFTESNETNNVAVKSGVHAVRDPFIDLTGRFSYFSLPTNTAPGAWGYGIVGVQNGGNVATWGWINLDMYTDDDGDLGNGGDTYMSTSRRYVYIPAGGTSWQVVYYNVPAGLAAGDYQLCLVVDAANEFAESNETNNAAARATVHHVAGLGAAPLAGATDVDSRVDAIVGFYRSFLGREPDDVGLSAWLAAAEVGWSLDDIANGFAASDEFIAKHGDVITESTDTEFVAWLYREVLGRGYALAELDAWVPALRSGLLSRGEVMTRFVTSAEYTDLVAFETLDPLARTPAG